MISSHHHLYTGQHLLLLWTHNNTLELQCHTPSAYNAQHLFHYASKLTWYLALNVPLTLPRKG